MRPLAGAAAPEAGVEPVAGPEPRPSPAPAVIERATVRKARPGTTLDGTWDRRLARGLVAPDAIVDLHGHSLAAAYDLLDRRLDQAIAAGDRVLLLITGKPPADHGRHAVRPVVRGAIRAAVGDWLASSRHAADIAAVRNAAPRHGGAGALYIVLRKKR